MNLRVLETNVLHAGDVVYFLDATTGTHADDRERVDATLDIELSNPPPRLRWLQKAGAWALWLRPDDDDGVVAGMAGDAARSRPAAPPLRLVGRMRDPHARYNPRSFDITVGDGGGHALLLYPSPLGSRLPGGGALIGTVRRADGTPLPWALLDLTVAAPEASLAFVAQTDAHGDFVLGLRRLPPLPESVEHYPAQLTIRAHPVADPRVPADPAAADVALDIEAADDSGFHAHIALSITPGEVRLLRSFDKNHLAVQPRQP
ncbi:carboxypeptidase regulatory-like domain-containing protein [Thioalkalivibrio paradoxus]|uniref:Uncharacterized protein n=1 Tax=Thioalkalivibrio paradoxus ARh 1 TaxID=713585 RepID=W0DMR8_9GAMM|nr:carboxypeptidase regulatory-like domain-containing protein [Thioalkalivibrio paradoxus]AHE99889.1 hypothetical protein THITH_03080 [Thioalkalivibrio paradoxus ARh 1]